MKKNFTPNFETKLARYSAVAGTMIAAGSVNAQITYYDINPDIVYANSSGAIDVTGDSQADFAFYDTNLVSFNAWQVLAFPIGTNGIAGSTVVSGSNSYYYPFKMTLGTPINSGLTWLTGSVQGSMALSISGSFPYNSHWQADATDGYLGMKLDVAGNTLYGWLRVSVAANSQTMTLKDLGFNATPNTPINAGATGAGISELDGKASIFNFNNVLNVNLIENLSNANLSVVSMSGQVVVSKSINGSEQIDLNAFAAGIYTVSLQSNEGIMVEKIMIK